MYGKAIRDGEKLNNSLTATPLFDFSNKQLLNRTKKQANFLSKFRGLFQFFRHMYNGHSRNLYSQTNKLTEERNKEILTDIVDKMFLSNLPHFNISEIWN
uniref:PiggyBac transposable element-derived protein domain-containing protein n=1 Tax=Ditylenchus dipsaci TaxID=166011 RepID=A0A915D4C1_9BILA